MGAKATTMSGLSGLGDIMLTCYGNLSRNRSVGIRLGRGEKLEEILASSPQVRERVQGVCVFGVEEMGGEHVAGVHFVCGLSGSRRAAP